MKAYTVRFPNVIIRVHASDSNRFNAQMFVTVCKTSQTDVSLEFMHLGMTKCSLSSFSEGFYHVWAWQPSWSCDLNVLKFLS